jgi:hypothetical protein
MTGLIINLRLIDHQEQPGVLQEVYEGPDKRRVRFFARVHPDPTAFSQVWSGSEWKSIHNLLDPGLSPSEAIARLFKATEDILGWTTR